MKKNNYKINYKYFKKEGNMENIIILHWWWWSSNSWVETWKLLSEIWFNAIIPDLPGFWKTKMNYIFDLDKYSSVVINFIKELKLDNIILWWHSNGWAISIKIVNSKLLNIKKLVLNNSAWIRNDKKRNFKKIFFKIISDYLKIFNKIPAYKKIRILFYKLIWSTDYINSEKNPYLKQTYLNIIKEDLKEDIKNIDLDTLLIRWEKDTYTPISDAYFFRNNIKKSRLCILDNETHWIHLKNPKRLVDTFLKNI